MPNRLQHAASPYLRMHAENPVDWHPWDAEALEKARREEKPIFLSIGYLACHWCHVMARESFEDPETAALMNEHFINIKVDREERPDLDSLYMQATVALTGSGGWPMSVFLTPDLRPFYAGTYFPPTPRYGLPSFRQVLLGLARAWKERRDEILSAAQEVISYLQQAGRFESQQPLSLSRLDEAESALRQTYDWANGGWGAAPKFPQAMALDFLLMRYLASRDEALLRLVRHNLDAMAQGGMYDLVGGGFHRYSTDARWHVPHYEKMLYDNALLARTYLHAWQVSGQQRYLRVCLQTLDFVARELTSPEGGFYSSLAADSEGEEGKFYLWTTEELYHALGEESVLFNAAHGIGERNTADGLTLRRALDEASLAVRFTLDPQTVAAKLEACYARLFQARLERPRPETDDKVITSWNGLMLAAFAEAARALAGFETERQAEPVSELRSAKTRYLSLATRNAEFLLTALRPDGRLHRAWRAGQLSGPAFLEDYAALILGLLELYQTDFQPRWFVAALDLADEMSSLFPHPSAGFYDTPEDQRDLPLRTRDLQDNATPSGNALAAEALLKLATFTNRPDWHNQAEEMLGLVETLAGRYPTAFGRWLQVAHLVHSQRQEVAIIGSLHHPQTQALLRAIWSTWRPTAVVAVADFPPPPGSPPLLENRPPIDDQPTAYVCEGFVCRQPVTAVEDLITSLW
ncbi:MAG: thioredoxin domain-containing protein [Anaerolineales bacterium]|nr:thioredoxin domain-containing protein [Anaerolineales bacterium]